MRNRLLLGRCEEVLQEFPENYFDSIVTDPPYGISFMNKHWDYDVPSVYQWQQILRVLKPGGHLLSFGGTRTYHRLVVNIEDAGFEIRDQLQWLYSSGFPKSLNINKNYPDKMHLFEPLTADIVYKYFEIMRDVLDKVKWQVRKPD